ncbi:putative ribonuclease H-like domain protein [Vibrio phage 193E37-1]|nr:putative ribonuclease H-like domain protein [Vibrio phage 193E37-1]
MTRHIYVDYSRKEGKKVNGKFRPYTKRKDFRGGVGIVIVEEGKVSSVHSIHTQGFHNTSGERLALLKGLGFCRDGDVLCTDQEGLVYELSEQGKLKTEHSHLTTGRLNHRINTVLSFKKGVTIVFTRSHNNDEYNNLSDKLAKVRSTVKQHRFLKKIAERYSLQPSQVKVKSIKHNTTKHLSF